MKKLIAKLRIFGLVTFVLFIVSAMDGSSKSLEFKFTQIQQALIFISLVSFAVIMALQLYRFYISKYSEEEDNISYE